LVPASFQQQRLWFLSQLPGAGVAYNEALVFELRGPLERDVLRRAFDVLAQRHEALRTRLVCIDGEVLQHIDPPETGFAFSVVDLMGQADGEARLEALRHEEITTAFDLSRGPLGRCRLVALDAEHHMLLLTMHHTVFDGRSLEVMLGELSVVYARLLRGEQDALRSLPPLPLQYGNYARDQRVAINEGRFAAQENFWQESLTSAPPVLELATDRPRAPERDHLGGQVPIHLDGELTARLRSLARDNGATLFVVMLTAWFILLSRLTGQEDIVVGTPTANRRHSEVKGAIGFFVNSLALRADLSGDPTAQTAITRVRTALRAALKHQELPFERVVELVSPPRSAAHTPVFQTMCVWAPTRRGLIDLPGVEAEPLYNSHAPAKFDLSLSMEESRGEVIGELHYASSLFDRTTVERYAGHLRQLLWQMVQRPGTEVSALALMDADERRRLLEDWSTGQSTEAAEALTGPEPDVAVLGLVERFEAQARTRSTAPALVCDGEQLSYGELERRANRLAQALVARGIGPDQVVGLHAGRSVDLGVGLLGILKSGAAYLPLDPAQPAERLAKMVEDAVPALVLSDADSPPEQWQRLHEIEAESVRDDAPHVRVDPGHLAYVIYTSGSTGRPKRVAVTHASVLNLFDDWLLGMGDAAGEASSAWASIGFDASIPELLLPLTYGGVVHIVPDRLRPDPEALMGWMREHRIVHAFLPPAYVRWIDEDPEKRLAGLRLRQLLTGVESLSEAALHRLCRQLPGLRICYGYGPTEATVYSTAYYEPQPVDRPCPIGRPVRNARLYLLDRRMQPVPVGVVGEVYLGGAALARGYLNRPDLTQEHFLEDPFVPGERVYRTGDLARWLPDGNAEYVGRGDDQVKLRGFRIEPREIEAALLALDGVREAAVLPDRDERGELRLVAGISRGDLPLRQPDEWHALLAQHIPDYMIPARFVELPSLPLNRSGKLDRARLVELARTSTPAQVNVATPRDEVEMALYRIWKDILVTADIGIRDNFFHLGGTSLAAIKMAHAVQEKLGQTLPIREIVLHPTIEALGGLLRQGTAHRTPSSLIEFRAGDGHESVVCIHPAGGTAFCYLPLSNALPETVGVYGIQSPGVNPGEDVLADVESMAENYLQLIKPLLTGPLVLTGLSFGGLVAHEMGRRLAAVGKTDVSVVLLDTRSTDAPAERTAMAPVEMAEFRDKLIRFNGMFPGIDDAQIARYFHIYNHNRMTAAAYRPDTTAARLVLFQANAEPQDTDTSRQAGRDFWRLRAKADFAVEPVECGHWELLEGTELKRVAEVIEDELNRAEAGR
jgi:amino acid adenylation domain-containing protein